MAVDGEEAEKKQNNMVMLRSRDGMEFVVPELEASQSLIIQDNLKYDDANYIIPSDGDRTKYKLIRLAVQGNTLSKVIRYCHKHASGHPDPDWDTEFVTRLDNETLYDLILASHYLQIRQLIDLLCHPIACKIKGKSPFEICDIFSIKSVFTRELDEETIAQRSQHSCTSPRSLVGVPILPVEKPCLAELELEEKALRALHVVRSQDFTKYDPKLNGFVCNRFNLCNVALFNHDEESNFCRGPPLHKIPSPMRDSIVRSCVNVISVKVQESDVGFPVNVFGTIVARDEVDYRCVYLFRRERDDPQLIRSQDDILSLIDPCRALVPTDQIYFEFDLQISCDGGATKDFSKGVVLFDRARLPTGKETAAMDLWRISWLSRMELSCALVYHPVEATVAINILEGPCNLSKVYASTPGNFKDHIILYEAAAAATLTVLGEGGASVPLTRSVIAVSLDQKLALFFVGGDVFEHLVLALGHSDEVIYRKMGSAQLEVKVTWTAIPRRQRSGLFKRVGNQRLLL